MNNQEIYQKKQQVISARAKLDKQGNSYDSASTACFAFILLALAVAGAGFFFMVIQPDNPSQFVINLAYIAAGALLLFIIITIIVRVMSRVSRKPLLKEKKRLFSEYEQALRVALKYEYGLIPVDDRVFHRKLYLDTLGDSDSVVLNLMSLDGQDKINLTLKEVDEDSLVFTKYGVPYQPKERISAIPEMETQKITAVEKPDTTTDETVSISELFQQVNLQQT